MNQARRQTLRRSAAHRMGVCCVFILEDFIWKKLLYMFTERAVRHKRPSIIKPYSLIVK